MPGHVSLLAMGGTISTLDSERGALPHYGAEHLGTLLGGAQGLRIRSRDVAKVSSHNVTPHDMWILARAVKEEVDSGAVGVVITHGTDTLEETAYALALLLRDDSVPVVLTGAMRTPGTPGADGPANLAAAMAVAAHRPIAGYGPVVVMNDEVHAARWVTKRSGTRVAAFESAGTGPVASVTEGRVALLAGRLNTADRLLKVAEPSKRVELVWVAAGMDGFVVDAIAEGIDGLVIAGTGGGHVPAPMADALVRLAQSGCPVVLASRCHDGSVLSATYGGAGSEVHLLSAGLLPSGSLSPVKARLRLLLGLSAGLPAVQLFPPSAGPVESGL